MVKRKKGFTIAEVIIALAVIMLVAAVCIETCIAALGVSQKNSNRISVISASDEFVTCFKNAEAGTEGTTETDKFLNAFNQRLLASLDIVTAENYAINDNSFDGSTDTITLTYGIRSLEINLGNGSEATYTFISDGYMRVEATVITTLPQIITVTGYAEGVSSAVCEYEYEYEYTR